MSVVPTLPLWSSVKTPKSLTSKLQNKSTPYVSSCKTSEAKIHKNTQEGELVNLRIPSSFRKQKENSSPNLKIERNENPKKKKLTKRKKINYVTVPENLHEADDEVQKSKPKLKSSQSYSYKGDCNEEDSSDDWELDLSKLMLEEEDDVPTVKPCTLEELENLNLKYNLIEEKIKKITKNVKNKRLSPERVSNDDAKENINSFDEKPVEEIKFKSTDFRFYKEEELDSDVPSICDLTIRQTKHEVTRSNVKPANEEYYKTKLAQLYLIELGLTS